MAMIRAIKAEFLKLKGSKVPLWTALAVVAYSCIAIAGGLSQRSPDFNMAASMTSAGGAWAQAAELGYYEFGWESLLRQNVQGIAGGVGILLFGFVTAYVFGRERKEGTDATLLTAPVERRLFAVAKLGVVAVWVLGLTLFWFSIQTAGFAVLRPPGFSWDLIGRSLGNCLQATAILFAMLPIVGLVALLGKPGYLKPMIATAMLSSVGPIVSSDSARFFPPTMPVLIDGAAWMPVVSSELTVASWAIVAGTFVIGSAVLVWMFGRTTDAR